jgi:hypothetical protein
MNANEPVAWLHKPSGTVFEKIIACVEPDDLIPLYELKLSLSDAEIDNMIMELPETPNNLQLLAFAKAILRKAEEK